MRFKKRSLLIELLLILIFILFTFPNPAGEIGIKQPTIRFMAGYKPQANLPFVGVYVALEKGFYKDAGLNVTIQHSTGRGEHVQYLAAGEVDVITVDAANLIQRRTTSKVPLVSIALIGQTGQQAFAALKSGEISSIEDWQGKTIGYKGTPTFDFLALMRRYNLTDEDVNLVNVGFDPRVMTEGLVDIYPVYKSNEPYLLEKLGFETILWDPQKFGVETLGLAFVTSDMLIDKKKIELITFLEATIDGIQYAAANEQEAVDIVLKYAESDTDREHMLFMMREELKDAISPMGFGYQDLARWRLLQKEMFDQGMIDKLIPIEDFINTNLWEQSQ